MAHTLRMYRGDDRTFPLTVEFDGEAVDLSAALEVRFTAKYRSGDGDSAAVISLVLGDGVEFTTDGTDGGIAVTIPAAATVDVRSGAVLLWDVEVQAPFTSGGPELVRTWPEDDGVPALGKLVIVGDVSGSGAS